MNEDKSIDWNAMIDKLSSYSGTIRDFYKENNIPEKQFYAFNKIFNSFHFYS